MIDPALLDQCPHCGAVRGALLYRFILGVAGSALFAIGALAYLQRSRRVRVLFPED